MYINVEGDVNLLEGDAFYDIHAIAGLLKLYLRELSESILSKELRSDFLRISEKPDREDRIQELLKLVKLLPIVNYISIKVLLGHLIRVVKHCDQNKMNVRNISIVFSPTLGIPAGTFTLMMAEYFTLFDDAMEKENQPPNDESGSLKLSIASNEDGRSSDPEPARSMTPDERTKMSRREKRKTIGNVEAIRALEESLKSGNVENSPISGSENTHRQRVDPPLEYHGVPEIQCENLTDNELRNPKLSNFKSRSFDHRSSPSEKASPRESSTERQILQQLPKSRDSAIVKIHAVADDGFLDEAGRAEVNNLLEQLEPNAHSDAARKSFNQRKRTFTNDSIKALEDQLRQAPEQVSESHAVTVTPDIFPVGIEETNSILDDLANSLNFK